MNHGAAFTESKWRHAAISLLHVEISKSVRSALPLPATDSMHQGWTWLPIQWRIAVLKSCQTTSLRTQRIKDLTRLGMILNCAVSEVFCFLATTSSRAHTYPSVPEGMRIERWWNAAPVAIWNYNIPMSERATQLERGWNTTTRASGGISFCGPHRGVEENEATMARSWQTTRVRDSRPSRVTALLQIVAAPVPLWRNCLRRARRLLCFQFLRSTL